MKDVSKGDAFTSWQSKNKIIFGCNFAIMQKHFKKAKNAGYCSKL